ncbi:MAG TPA: DNA repair exonuclease [Armatimonadota bacterium]|jgi:DNA repair exonuclease SbcCD nuclease subunit
MIALRGVEGMALCRFLHTADIHLSRPFGFLPPQLAEERRHDQRKTLTRIVDLALEREVDLVLIAGDLFDSPDPDPTDIEAVTREFSRLAEAGKRIFIIPGNHDYASPGSFWHHMAAEGLHIFLDTEWKTIVLDDLGVSISGIAFHRAKSERRALEGFERVGDMPSIVMVHASYEMYEGVLDRYHPFSASELSAVDASYIALGHYHRHNPIPCGSVTACYPGTPEGISFDQSEVEDRFVVIGEVEDDGRVNLEPVKVNRRTMRAAEIDCTSFDSQTGLFDAVRKFCEANVLLQLKLTGTSNSTVDSAVQEIPERFRDSCFYMTLNSDLSLPSDLEADDRTIRGRFCRHLLTQIEEAPDPERRRVLRRALELGMASFSDK